MAYDLDHCPTCGDELDEAHKGLARHNLAPTNCSAACVRADYKKRTACCDQAEEIYCVCTASYRCPVHGIMHIGTHD